MNLVKNIGSNINVTDNNTRKKQIEDFKKHLYNADMLFSGLDNYRKQYLQWVVGTKNWKIPALLNNKKIGEYKIPKEVRKKYITKIDISQPDFIYRETPYTKFAIDVWKDKYTILDGERIEKDIKSRYIYLNARNYAIINKVYGLGEEKKTKEEISNIYGVSNSRIDQIVDIAMERARDPFCAISSKTPIKLDTDREQEVINKYFENHEIFDNGSVGKIDEYVKNQILKIIKIGTLERSIRDESIKYFDKIDEYDQNKIIKKYLGEDVKVSRLKFLDKDTQISYKKNRGYEYGTISTDEIVNNTKFKEAAVKEILDEYGEIKQITRIKYDEIQDKIRMEEEKRIEESRIIEGTNIRDYPIEELKFDKRVYDRLCKAGIKRLSDILNKDKDFFMKIRGFGDGSYENLVQIIHSKGAVLNEEKEAIEQQKVLKNIQDYNVIPNIKIDKLGMTTRTYNALRRAGVMTLRQLLPMTRKDFKEVRNLGKIGYEDAVDTIHKLGLKTRDDLELEMANQIAEKNKNKQLEENSTNSSKESAEKERDEER